MKDPAFLFYSKDFYEGTRMMLPDERACYIDLLIYQHQNGTIPDDIKRLTMYCSGVSESTLEATLKAKFEKTDNGWENLRLKNEISDRENYKNEQSFSGKIGQFWKKVYKIYSKSEINYLKKHIDREQIINILQEINITNENDIKGALIGLLKQRLSNNANVNADANEDEDKRKEKVSEEKFIPKKDLKKSEQKEKSDPDSVVELFHKCCPSFPKILKLSGTRKHKIKLRLEEMNNDLILLKKVFDTMEKSKFLRGDNKGEWKATFDWIFDNSNNWVKVIEGNYNDKNNNDEHRQGDIHTGSSTQGERTSTI